MRCVYIILKDVKTFLYLILSYWSLKKNRGMKRSRVDEETPLPIVKWKRQVTIEQFKRMHLSEQLFRLERGEYDPNQADDFENTMIWIQIAIAKERNERQTPSWTSVRHRGYLLPEDTRLITALVRHGGDPSIAGKGFNKHSIAKTSPILHAVSHLECVLLDIFMDPTINEHLWDDLKWSIMIRIMKDHDNFYERVSKCMQWGGYCLFKNPDTFQYIVTFSAYDGTMAPELVQKFEMQLRTTENLIVSILHQVIVGDPICRLILDMTIMEPYREMGADVHPYREMGADVY